MGKPKPKPDIFWLPDDKYAKLLFHTRNEIHKVIYGEFRTCYSDNDRLVAVQGIMKAVEDAMLVVRGVDKPIKSDYQSPHED